MSTLTERMIAAGHKLRLAGDGRVDHFAFCKDNHNGPVCTECGLSRCSACDRHNGMKEVFCPCPGKEEMERRAKEARRAQWVELCKEFGEAAETPPKPKADDANLPSPTDPVVTHSDSPLYLLAVMVAARKSDDRILLRVTRRRLTALGVDVRFGDELPPRPRRPRKGAARD